MPQHTEVFCDDDCVNCETHIDTDQPHIMLTLAAINRGGGLNSGEMKLLEERTVCPDCSTVDDAQLSQYMRFHLS